MNRISGQISSKAGDLRHQLLVVIACAAPSSQEEWRALIGTMPQGWFPRECHAALAALCRHTCRARLLGARISSVQAKCLGNEEGLKALDLMLKMLERETRCIVTLSRSMRLTQQTRINKNVAGARAVAGHGASAYDDGRLDELLGEDDD